MWHLEEKFHFTKCYSSIKPWWSVPVNTNRSWVSLITSSFLPNLRCVCVLEGLWEMVKSSWPTDAGFCSVNGTLSAVCSCWPSAYPILSSSLTRGLTTNHQPALSDPPPRRTFSSQTNRPLSSKCTPQSTGNRPSWQLFEKVSLIWLDSLRIVWLFFQHEEI